MVALMAEPLFEKIGGACGTLKSGDDRRGTSGRPSGWMNLQGRYDLEVERDRLAGELDRIRPLASA
jgi:hypothetical protein